MFPAHYSMLPPFHYSIGHVKVACTPPGSIKAGPSGPGFKISTSLAPGGAIASPFLGCGGGRAQHSAQDVKNLPKPALTKHFPCLQFCLVLRVPVQKWPFSQTRGLPVSDGTRKGQPDQQLRAC